jgi:hypothetical protein
VRGPKTRWPGGNLSQGFRGCCWRGGSSWWSHHDIQGRYGDHGVGSRGGSSNRGTNYSLQHGLLMGLAGDLSEETKGRAKTPQNLDHVYKQHPFPNGHRAIGGQHAQGTLHQVRMLGWGELDLRDVTLLTLLAGKEGGNMKVPVEEPSQM